MRRAICTFFAWAVSSGCAVEPSDEQAQTWATARLTTDTCAPSRLDTASVACSSTSAPITRTAVAIGAAAPPRITVGAPISVSLPRRADGLFEGEVEISRWESPLATTRHLYASSANVPVALVDFPERVSCSGNPSGLEPGCSTWQLVLDLKEPSGRVRLGPTSESSVTLLLVNRELRRSMPEATYAARWVHPSLAQSDAEAETIAASRATTSIRAGQFGDANAPAIETGVLYGVRLSDVGYSEGGLTFTADSSGPLIIHVGTRSVSPRLVPVDSFKVATNGYVGENPFYHSPRPWPPRDAEELLARYPSEGEFRGATQVNVRAGVKYRIELGPDVLAEDGGSQVRHRWVRLLMLRPPAPWWPPAPAPVSELGMGLDSVCALSCGDRVKCWGYGMNGQLPSTVRAYGARNSDRGRRYGELGRDLPALLASSGAVRKLVGGANANYALLDDGSVRCWGLLHLGTEPGQGSVNVFDDRNVLRGPGLETTHAIAIQEPAVDLASGANHACALASDGRMQCWGDNIYGQLGVGTNRMVNPTIAAAWLDVGRPVTALALGPYFTIALLDDGKLRCWGDNRHGQCGRARPGYIGRVPAEVPALLPDISLGTGVTVNAVTAGDYHACALLSGGLVKCWGYNGEGQLGIGRTDENVPQVKNVRAEDVPLLRGMGDELPSVELAGPAQQIVAGSRHSCALLADGRVQCWGNNAYGQLGVGDRRSRGRSADDMGTRLPAVDLGPDFEVRVIRAAGHNTCALATNGKVKCWGLNAFGTAGQGDTVDWGAAPNELATMPPIDVGACQ